MKQHSIFKLCLILMAFLALPAFAQNQIYKGTVVDELGEPIIGATVRVVDSTVGTITDMDGNFAITVTKGQNVEISFLGYISVTTNNFNQTKIVLQEDTQKLEEVVVVGYGSQKKAHLTGAIATVPMNDIQDLAGGDLASSLSGMVNGLSVSGGNGRPGEAGRISIRTSGLFGEIGSTSQEPLYVIDGYVYPNDVVVGRNGESENMGATAFNNLDPSTIESISVLKDASAAVYGARAANGVILVTTKKGVEGKPQISYSGQFGFTDEMSRTKMLNAYDYGRLYNAVVSADPTKVDNMNKTLEMFQLDELNAMKGLNYDLLDKYWETGFTQKHSINLSGASERANYFAGISYFDQEGNIGSLDYNRWNYRAGVDLKINSWLKAGLTVSGDYGKKNKPNVKVGGSSDEKQYEILLTRPQYIPEEVNGLPIAYYGVSNTEKSSNYQNYSHHLLQNSGDYNNTMSSNMTINGNISVDFGGIWQPLKGLNGKFSYSKSISTSKNNQYGSSYELYYMKERFGSGGHLYTPIGGEDLDAFYDLSNFALSNGGQPIENGGQGGYLNRNISRADNYQMNFTLTYDRDFGQHHVGALFSIEKSEAESEYVFGEVKNLYSFSNGQSNSAAPVPSEGGEEAKTLQSTDFNRAESGTLSYVGRINYAYANKYLFEFLFRSDSSTKFAPENYWGFFPSVSAGWVISEESWLKDKVNWIDFLKVRGSFGLTGRDNTKAWQWMTVYNLDADKGPVFGVGSSSIAGGHISINNENAAVNRGIHWDKSYKANFGVDFNTLNNRLALTLEGYHEWHREILLPIKSSISGTIGTESADLNFGKMNAWGVEVSATWRDKIGDDFKYRIGVNTGYSDNKMLEMDWDKENIFRTVQKGMRTDVGTWGMQCLGMFRSFQEIEEYFEKYNITTYMNKTKDQIRPGMLIYKDVRGAYNTETGKYEGPDGVINDQDQVRLSNRSNPWGFTTNLSAEWKGISLTAQLNASWGGYSHIPTAALKPDNGMEVTNMPSFWKVEDMYTYQDIFDENGNLLVAANTNGSLPNLAYSDVNAASSTFWRVSGARVRLSRLTLAYSIPSEIVRKLGVSSCRFNITGQNLLNLYNPYPDNFMDPSSGYGTYPTLRKFTVGVNLSF